MDGDEQLDEMFLQRARERGLLTDSQIDNVHKELKERRADEPDLGASDLVVENGWIGVEAALALLDAKPEDTVEDLRARVSDSNVRARRDTQTLKPEGHARSSDTERFNAVEDEGIADDEHFDEVPKLVEPLPANYAVDDAASQTSSGESHLEMELPPPPGSSGDSIFDDSESKPSLTPMSTEAPGPAPLEAEPLDTLDSVEIDDDEEEIVQDVTIDPEAIEPEVEATAGFDGEEVRSGVGDTRGFDGEEVRGKSDTRGFDGKEVRDGRDDTHGFDEDNASVRTADGNIPDHLQPAPSFEMRGGKGADMDFAAFGDDEPLVDDEIEESQVVSDSMSDSAVGEVLEQADDGYFGPAADLTSTPQEVLDDSIAPPKPMEESTLFDSEKLKSPDEVEEDFVATAPPSAEQEEPSEVTDDSEVDVSVTLPGEFPTDASTIYDESNVSLEDITNESEVSEVTTGNRTAFATGEVARPGLRDRTDSKLGVESNITGEAGEVITGSEMTLADLRRQMGIGSGVKVGGGESGAVGRLKKGSKKKRYSVIREIARGGMGKVIEVEDNDLRRSVALKVLRKEMLDRTDLVERFLEEAQITGQLEHPNIVPVHEIGVDGRGNLYFTMKLVEGEEFASIIKRLRKKDPSAQKAYPIARLVDVFIKVCEGVSFAHSRGVIHRDLKPANIMVGRFGEVQIMDWGVAKIVGRKEDTVDREVKSDRQDDDAARTMAGSILGTPSYMSPEQARGEVNSMGPEADIFSLGVILYELLALTTPWTAQTSAQVIDQVKNYDPEPPSKQSPDRRIPPELEQLAMKCLVKAPNKRIASAQDLVDNLKSWQEGGTLAAVEYSLGQLIAKWVARNKVAVIMVLVVLVALTAGGIGVGQYLEQQNLKKADDAVARAETTLKEAQVAYEIGDFEKSESLANEANKDATSALLINEDNEQAQEMMIDAATLAASSKRAITERADAIAEERDRERRLEEFNIALGEARDAMASARQSDEDGDDVANVKVAYEDADREYVEAQSIKVEGTDDERAEIATARNEINNWIAGYEQRKAAEKGLMTLRELVGNAEKKFAAAKELPGDDYEQASTQLVDTISISDRAIAVPVSGAAADKLRDQAQLIKAQAALEFADRAMTGDHYDVADLMLNSASATGKLAEQVRTTREELDRKVQARSEFKKLLEAARAAVTAGRWVTAQSAIQSALTNAETSEFATDNDKAELARMMQLAQLEELHAKDGLAKTSEELTRVLNGYNALISELKDPDYHTRALTYADDVSLRLGTALYEEGSNSEDDAVKGELFERALEFVTDKAVIAEITSELSDIKLRLALDAVSDELVLLPRGNFVIGSNRESDQNPQHLITNTSYIFMDKYLVTNEQYKEFVDAGAYTKPELWHEDAVPLLGELLDTTGQPGPATWAEGGFDESLANYPVTGINWYEAAAYAQWAGKRLPTPDEWEMAAGAAQTGETEVIGDYPFGPRAKGPVEGVTEARPVATTEWDASPLGVRDLGCNVAEWTRGLMDDGSRAVVKGAEPGLRPELFYRYARRAKNSVARLNDRSTGRGFRCAQTFTLNEEKPGDSRND